MLTILNANSPCFWLIKEEWFILSLKWCVSELLGIGIMSVCSQSLSVTENERDLKGI